MIFIREEESYDLVCSLIFIQRGLMLCWLKSLSCNTVAIRRNRNQGASSTNIDTLNSARVFGCLIPSSTLPAAAAQTLATRPPPWPTTTTPPSGSTTTPRRRRGARASPLARRLPRRPLAAPLRTTACRRHPMRSSSRSSARRRSPRGSLTPQRPSALASTTATMT